MRAILIAGAGSEVGKTTVTLGVMAALRRRGLKVQAFKVGPDFIDPGLHTLVTGRPSYNLDGWLLSRDYILDCFLRHSSDADIAVIEGVMGLFDGYRGTGEEGSTAQIAKWLGVPVVLVVDVKGMSRSAAALLQGFEGFDPSLEVTAVVFNRTGSKRHFQWLKEAVGGTCKARVLGHLPWDDGLRLPERHLGLVTALEDPFPAGYIERLATAIEAGLDLTELLGLSGVEDLWARGPGPEAVEKGPVCRIGVAYDQAFCFYYPDSLDILRGFGAELICFSPIRDPHLPKGVHGLYFGGGYPELYADALSRNEGLKKEVLALAEAGAPIYAECGGFMYLCQGIVDMNGRYHPMVGVFNTVADIARKRLSLGYREIRLVKDCPLGKAGEGTRGHEFHYSEIREPPSEVLRAYLLEAQGESPRQEGYLYKNVLGTYVHQHFGSNPAMARNFVLNCRSWAGIGHYALGE